MALSLNVIFEIEQNGGDANGGAFNPANTHMAADLAATSGNTSSPVVTSASYNFVAGDVGYYLFIQSGTNWIPGWYQIASVAANAATLTAAAGAGWLWNGTAKQPVGVTTVDGCATTASPSGGVWTMDYSINPTAVYSGITLTIASTTTFTSAGHAGVNVVGNHVNVAAGGSAAVGVYEIVSVSAGTATIDRSWTAASGSSTARIGGAYATPGFAGSAGASTASQPSCTFFIKFNAIAFSTTSNTTNAANGCLSAPSGNNGTGYPVSIVGYNINRSIYNTDSSRPTIDANVNSLTNGVILTSTNCFINNINVTNVNARTAGVGIYTNGTRNIVWQCKVNGVATCFNGSDYSIFFQCEAVSFGTVGFKQSSVGNFYAALFCSAHNGAAGSGGFNTTPLALFCEAYSAASGTSYGFNSQDTHFHMFCTADSILGPAAAGFFSTTSHGFTWNCISTSSGQYGYANASGAIATFFNNNADYGSGTAAYGSTVYATLGYQNQIVLSGTPYTAPLSGNYSLASTGAAAPCHASASPASIPPGSTPTKNDLGAAQSASNAGAAQIVNFRRRVR